MNTKKALVAFLSIALFTATAFYAQQMYAGKVSIIGRNLGANILGFFTSVTNIGTETQEKPSCEFTEPVIPQFDAELQGVSLKDKLEKEEIFETVISFKNNSNIPWFSEDSGCSNVPLINLGTSGPKDRETELFQTSPEHPVYWKAKSRIKMETLRVNPGEIAYFKFWSKAPNRDDITIEHFTPVVEGRTWIDQAQASLTIRTGNYDPALESKAPYAIKSRSLAEFNLAEEKQILVDVSEQIMHLKIGDDIIQTFPVSTGAYKTPTPYGEFRIKFKQDVRVSGKWPHYIMPNFMWFRDGGYGIHALPSLKTDGGHFWREARSHIQQRVSHGCIRLLPEDSDVVFNFGEPGTRLTIQN